jgi:hypothetical protein
MAQKTEIEFLSFILQPIPIYVTLLCIHVYVIVFNTPPPPSPPPL